MDGFILNQLTDRKFLLQALATVGAYCLLKFAIFLRVRHKRYQLLKYYGIPGPKPGYINGSLWEYRKDKRTYKVDDRFKALYGKVFGVYFGDYPEISISDPEILRAIFLERMSSFKERSIVYLKNPMTKSILFAPHNRWKVLRKVMSPSFNSYNMRGGASIEFIEDTIRAMLGYIDMRIASDSRAKSVDLDVLDLMKATTLNMISGMAISLPDLKIMENEPNVQSLDYFLSNVSEGAYQIAICFPFLKGLLEFLAEHFEYGKTLRDIRRGLGTTIDEGLEDLRRAERRQPATQPSKKRPQLIESLIKLHHEGKITRDEVICNCEAILVAGYDTTSTTLTYIFWTLGKYPKVQEKLRSELMAHGIESEYLEQVINEVMRLYPTVLNFITRLATETVSIGDLTIPKGSMVSLKTWLMHRNPKFWPEPEKFDPERFRKGVELHPCAFTPFGLGEKKCLGLQLAKLELKMITCDVLMRYKLTTIAPMDLELVTHSFVLSKPADKVIINLERL